jgi:nucleoid DNA-binding protein
MRISKIHRDLHRHFGFRHGIGDGAARYQRPDSQFTPAVAVFYTSREDGAFFIESERVVVYNLLKEGAMTRAELARRVYRAHGGITYQAAQVLVEEVIQGMTTGLSETGRLVISGFGTFKVVERKARMGRDMGKGTPVRIPSRKTVVFVPSRKWSGGKNP